MYSRTQINGVSLSNNTNEYTIEFWYYVSSYNTNLVQFPSFEVTWDYYTKIILSTFQNLIQVVCYPFYTEANPLQYQEFDKDINYNLYTWNYVQCSVSINTNRYYLNQNPEITIINSPPSTIGMDSTSLILKPGANTIANYGSLFLKEIKLWSTYNLRNFNNKCQLKTCSLF